MDINIKGDPGTGNTFILLDNGANYNNNPNATTVNNTTNIYMDGKRAQEKPLDDQAKKIIKNQILEYINRIKAHVTEKWSADYGKLWLAILDLKEVDAEVYNKGNQKGTDFNRNLVGNIIYTLKSKEIYDDTPCTKLAVELEGRKECSVRGQMGMKPSKIIMDAIIALIDSYGK